MNAIITGIGIVSVYGDNLETIQENMSLNKTPYGEKVIEKGNEFYKIKNFDYRSYLGDKGLRFWDPSALLIGSAVKKALDDSKVLERYKPDEVCFVLGKDKAEYAQIELTKSVLNDPVFGPNPGMVPNMSPNAIAGQIAIKFGFKGENITISNGAKSFNIAYDYAKKKIERGLVKVFIVATGNQILEKLVTNTVADCLSSLLNRMTEYGMSFVVELKD
jgi:3-oxoacyl-[acyl-carrier-protein] synthase II